jgi:hypothetical protein
LCIDIRISRSGGYTGEYSPPFPFSSEDHAGRHRAATGRKSRSQRNSRFMPDNLAAIIREVSLLGQPGGRIMILKFFSTRTVTEFAKSLAQDVAKRYPPAIANNPAQMVSQKRLSGILEEAFTRAAEFNRENKLGWYKKAKLGNEFKWELKEMGYDEKFIDVATEGLIVYVTRRPTPKT